MFFKKPIFSGGGRQQEYKFCWGGAARKGEGGLEDFDFSGGGLTRKGGLHFSGGAETPLETMTLSVSILIKRPCKQNGYREGVK